MSSSRKRSGFTLVEVLLALALSSLILVSATSLLVTLSRVWVDRPATREAFDAHVNGVARFLTATLDKVAPNPHSAKDPIVRLDHPIGSDDDSGEPPLITFCLKEAPPVLYWPREATAGVTCHFSFIKGEGLSILWFSNLQEMEPGEDGKLALKEKEDLFKTLLSPLVTRVTYCYYGEEDDPPEAEKEWVLKEDELEENLATGKYRLPRFVKLFFEHEDVERIVTIPIEKAPPHGLRAESN